VSDYDHCFVRPNCRPVSHTRRQTPVPRILYRSSYPRGEALRHSRACMAARWRHPYEGSAGVFQTDEGAT